MEVEAMQTSSDDESSVSDREVELETSTRVTTSPGSPSNRTPRSPRPISVQRAELIRRIEMSGRQNIPYLVLPEPPNQSSPGNSSRALFNRGVERHNNRRGRFGNSDYPRGLIPFLSRLLRGKSSHRTNNPRISTLNEYDRNESHFKEILMKDLSNETICIPSEYERVQQMAIANGVSLQYILQDARREIESIPYGTLLHYGVFHRNFVLGREDEDYLPGPSSRSPPIRPVVYPRDSSHGDICVHRFSNLKRGDLIFCSELILSCQETLNGVNSISITNHITYCCIIKQIIAKAMHNKIACEVFLNRWLKNYQKSPDWISVTIPYRDMLKAIYVNQYASRTCLDGHSTGTNLPLSHFINVCHKLSIEDLFEVVEQYLQPEQIAITQQILMNGQVTLNHEVPRDSPRRDPTPEEAGPLNQYILNAFCEKLNNFTSQHVEPRSFLEVVNINTGNNTVANNVAVPIDQNVPSDNQDNHPTNDEVNSSNDNTNPNDATNVTNNVTNVTSNEQAEDTTPVEAEAGGDGGSGTIDLSSSTEDNTNCLNNEIETENKATNQPVEEVSSTETKANMSIDEDDGQTCSICLETWTISGDHRLASLKCGHLFGNSCILRWLRQTPAAKRTCPSCKSPAQLRDIRFIFARKVVTVDNTEEEKLKSELQETKMANAQLKSEINGLLTMQRLFKAKLDETSKQLIELKQSSSQLVVQRRAITNWRYNMHYNTELCKNQTCRVLVYNNRSKSLYASLMSTGTLFPGYALRKIDCETWSTGKLIHLHPKAIRDAAYSESNDLLMTVGLDKCIKIIKGSNDAITTSIQSQMPLWSCCWDATNNNRIWAGGVGGVVCQYDIRQPKTAMSVTNSQDMSPVAALASVPGGIIACRLNSITAVRKTSTTELDCVNLPVEGTFTCVRSDPVTNDLLISCRTSTNHPRPRHIYCKSNLDDFEFIQYAKFEGAANLPIMSRSLLYTVGEQSYVSAFDGTDFGINTWSIASGNRLHSLGANDYVVDMTPITDSLGSLVHLATLSQSRVRIHQVTPIN